MEPGSPAAQWSRILFQSSPFASISLLETLVTPWLVEASPWSLSSSSLGILPVCMCVYLCPYFPFQYRHQSNGSSTHHTDFIFTNYICQDSISKSGHILRYWGLGFQHKNGGAYFSPWAYQVVVVVKNPSAKAGDARDMGLIPGLGRSPGEGNGNPQHYSCLGNPTDRRAWWATVHGVSSVRHDWAHTAQWQQFSTWQELSVGGDGETLSEAAAPTRLLYTFSLLSEVKGTKVLRDFLTLGTGPCTVASVTSQQSTAEGGEGRLLDLSQTRGHLLGVRQYLFSFPSHHLSLLSKAAVGEGRKCVSSQKSTRKQSH